MGAVTILRLVLLCMHVSVLMRWWVVRDPSPQIVHGFTPSPVQNQYVKQGMVERCLVAEDATGVVRVVSRDAIQPVNL